MASDSTASPRGQARIRLVDVGEVAIAARVLGSGPPVLLLHGYPQSQQVWDPLLADLAAEHTVVTTDLRGYGASSKPPGDAPHWRYSKRVMAQDQVAVMRSLGFDRFAVVGHDRGGRVAHRLCLDHPERVTRAAVIDIVPTIEAYATADATMAQAYFHWFFLTQDAGFPERLIGADPEAWLGRMFGIREDGQAPEPLQRAFETCLPTFRDPEAIHASCEDYRAGATIDLEHDEQDLHRSIPCPLLVLWGEHGFVGRNHDVLAVWGRHAVKVQGRALPAGHFVIDEAPQHVAQALGDFLGE